MPAFVWEGRNRKNQKRKGEMDAPNEAAVRIRLAQQKITSVKIKTKPKDIFENIAFLQAKVTQDDVIVFSRQFSTMIDAALPIVQCLEILGTQQENPTFKKIIKEVKLGVEGGDTLTDALKKYPACFDEFFVNMVAAGEAGGILDLILRRLSAYMEKMSKLKKKVKGAMAYPAVTLLIALVVVGVILVFVIPVFETMFADFGSALPVPTRIVINLSEFVQAKILWILGGIFLASFALKRIYRTGKGRLVMDGFFLNLPVVGILIRKVSVAKFTRTMGTMLSSGVSILDALDIVAKTAGNRVVENAIYDVRSSISEGQTMSDPLSESGVFPSMVCSMIAVGESTGALDVMLSKIADFYDDEVDQAVDNLTSLIEPFMLAFLGVIIGGLVVAMYLPVFQMAGAIG